MEVKVQIQNLEAVRSALKYAPISFAKHINKAIEKSIFKIQATTEPLTPVATSNLVGSLMRNAIFTPLKGVLDVSKNANYAYWVETMSKNRHKVGQAHFFETGVENSTSNINKYFNDALKDGLEEISQKAK
jgi:hypothetical protein